MVKVGDRILVFDAQDGAQDTYWVTVLSVPRESSRQKCECEVRPRLSPPRCSVLTRMQPAQTDENLKLKVSLAELQTMATFAASVRKRQRDEQDTDEQDEDDEDDEDDDEDEAGGEGDEDDDEDEAVGEDDDEGDEEAEDGGPQPGELRYWAPEVYVLEATTAKPRGPLTPAGKIQAAGLVRRVHCARTSSPACCARAADALPASQRSLATCGPSTTMARATRTASMTGCATSASTCSAASSAAATT